MKYILFVMSIFLCCVSYAESPIDCTNEKRFKREYIGNIENAKFEKVTTYSAVLREWVASQIEEYNLILKVTDNSKLPDEEALDYLLDTRITHDGPHLEIECLRSITKPNDILRNFNDNNGHIRRNGFALFREGELIGYFYYELVLA